MIDGPTEKSSIIVIAVPSYQTEGKSINYTKYAFLSEYKHFIKINTMYSKE
jgi:hypothetical protein